MPQYAIEGGKLYLAEALFSQYKYIIRCPSCPGVPGKPGFNLDSAGKPDASGLRRRAWSCTWSNSSKARRSGQHKCRRLQVSDFITLAKNSLEESDFAYVLHEVCYRFDAADERYKALQAFPTKSTPRTLEFQRAQPNISSQLSPPPSTSPLAPNTSIIPETPQLSSNTLVQSTLQLEVLSPLSESLDEQEFKARTPSTPLLAIQETPEVPPGFDSGDPPFATLLTRKRRAASGSSTDSKKSKQPRLKSLSAIRRIWRQQEHRVQDDKDEELPLPKLRSSPCPPSSVPYTTLSTSPTVRTLQVKRQNKVYPRQSTARRPRKKTKIVYGNSKKIPTSDPLRRLLQLQGSSSQ